MWIFYNRTIVEYSVYLGYVLLKRHQVDQRQSPGGYLPENGRNSGQNGQHLDFNGRNSGMNGQNFDLNGRNSGQNGQHFDLNVRNSGQNGQEQMNKNPPSSPSKYFSVKGKKRRQNK